MGGASPAADVNVTNDNTRDIRVGGAGSGEATKLAVTFGETAAVRTCGAISATGRVGCTT